MNPPVPRFQGKQRDDLKLISQGNDRRAGGKAGQNAIVTALPPPEPIALQIESNPGHKHDQGSGLPGRQSLAADGLGNAELSGAKLGGRSYPSQLGKIALDYFRIKNRLLRG